MMIYLELLRENLSLTTVEASRDKLGEQGSYLI